jgi:hypothetical protein
MNIILCTDLIFSTKITGTAKALNQPYAVARSLEKLQQLLDAGGEPGAKWTLIVDLNAPVDTIAAVRLAKAHAAAPYVVAFLSHVQAELAAAAREAGADRVLARSAFVNELPALLGPLSS